MATQEAGYRGRIVSIGGVLGKVDRGRQLNKVTMSASAIGQCCLEANPMRISAIIQNLDDAISILVDLGQDGTPSIRIYPHCSLQIDYNFPWTGSVWVYTAAGVASMYATEVSVP